MSARRRPATWPDDLLRVLDAYGVEGLADLARAMRVGASTVKNWAQRGAVPSEALKQASEDTGRSLDWLALGREPTRVPTQSETSDIPHEVASNLKDKISERDGHYLDEASSLRALGRMLYKGPQGAMEYCFVPRYRARSTVGPSAINDDVGVPGEIAFEAEWMRRTLGRNSQGFCLIDVVGSNMEPTFFDGDILVVDRFKRDPEAGGLFAIRRGSNVVVRRVQRLQNGSLQLISDNTAFHPELVSPEAAATFEIVGKIVWPRSR